MAITKLARWGNSSAVRIPKSILDKLHLNENDQLTVNVGVNNAIVLTPVKKQTSILV